MVLTKQDLQKLAKDIYYDNFSSEEESNDAISFFIDNVPYPDALELFHTELTPEEIVEKALSYKPIITPPPRKND